MSRLNVCTIVALSALSMTPSGATAQGRVELVPVIGSYLPMGGFSKLTTSSGSATFRQTIGVLGGLRLAFGVSPTTTIDVGGMYINTGWRQDLSSVQSSFNSVGLSTTGRALLSTARFSFRPRRSNLYVLAGGGYMVRGGDAWNEKNFNTITFKKSNPVGVVGFGLRAPGTSRFTILVDAELLLYSVDKVNGPTFFGTTNSFHKDLIVSVGIPLALTRP